MTIEELKLKTQNIVSELLPHVDSQQITNDQDIFYLGLNSINAMTLIFNLQEVFGITFNDTEISFDNFRTIDDIVTLVSHKTQV